MATPVVTGAVALMLEKDATLTPDQDIFTVGPGYVDIAAALANTEKILATEPALSPRVIRQTGRVVLDTSYSELDYAKLTNVVWGSMVVWGRSAVLPVSFSVAGDN